MNSGAGTTGSSSSSSSSSTPSSPISPASSTGSQATILERRNRRRSSALSGPHPADVPLTDSDQRLAALIARVNYQNAREAALQAPPQRLPTLAVPALDLSSDSTKSAEDPSSSIEKTPTQAAFRPLSSVGTTLSISRSHTRDGSLSTTTFQLLPIKNESDSKTPTKQDPKTSPIRREQKLSPLTSPPQEDRSLSPNQIPLNGDYELSPPLSPRQVQLSSYRAFTRRIYTSSPLESTFSEAEKENTEQLSPQGELDPEVAAKSPDTEEVPNPHSTCESFPPLKTTSSAGKPYLTAELLDSRQYIHFY